MKESFGFSMLSRCRHATGISVNQAAFNVTAGEGGLAGMGGEGPPVHIIDKLNQYALSQVPILATNQQRTSISPASLASGPRTRPAPLPLAGLFSLARAAPLAELDSYA